MARGVRRSPIEKLKDELKKTQETIDSYKSAIKTQEEKAKQLHEELKLEELKEISEILEERNMSILELKDILTTK